MKLLTRKTDYAVRALCFIAGKGAKVTADELVSALKIPRPFLRKTLQQLNRSRVLKSAKGRDGGFFLAMPGEKIFLSDLMRIFQGPIKLNECIFKKKICPRQDSCGLKKKLDIIEKKVLSDLAKINIIMLLRDGGFNEK